MVVLIFVGVLALESNARVKSLKVLPVMTKQQENGRFLSTLGDGWSVFRSPKIYEDENHIICIYTNTNMRIHQPILKKEKEFTKIGEMAVAVRNLWSHLRKVVLGRHGKSKYGQIKEWNFRQHLSIEAATEQWVAQKKEKGNMTKKNEGITKPRYCNTPTNRLAEGIASR